MYKCNKYDVGVDIKLGNGLYQFFKESASGKTRLMNEFKKLRAYKEPVLGYTYNDLLSGVSLKEEVGKQNTKVILLVD